MNDACLQTVPGTINTGLGAIFILVALFLLGTYSSVFVAAPLVVAFERVGEQPPSPERPRPKAAAGRR